MIAAFFAVAGLTLAVFFMPWSGWFGSERLAVLPEPHSEFGIILFTHFFVSGSLLLIQPLVYVASAALILMALARVIERLASIRRRQDQPEEFASPPVSPAMSKPIRDRLASARALRIAAVVVVIAWIVFQAVPSLWLLWSTRAAEGQLGPDAAFFLAGMTKLTASTMLSGGLALVLAALAAILDHFDRLDTQLRAAGR